MVVVSTRFLILLPAAVLALAAVTGCQGSGGPTAAGPTTGTGPAARPSGPAPAPDSAPAPVSAADLADPLSTLPLGTKVVLRRSGNGPQALDLTRLVGSSQEVTLHWLCAGGTSGVRVTNSSGTVLGSDCSQTSADANVAYNGAVPPSAGRDLAWKLRAGPATAWRLAVTVRR